MASSLHLHLPLHRSTAITTTTAKPNRYPTVRCGPRDNRGPLHKGRTLSIEAIQAVQSLKRSHRSDPSDNNLTVTKTLSRLVKSDLIAAFNELLRQDQFDLAVKVFSAIRSEEYYKPDLNLYAKLVTAMSSNKNMNMNDEIDELICEIGPADVSSASGNGVVTLIKTLIATGNAEATVRVYEMMKEGGWRCETQKDEYLGKVLSRGLRRLGKMEVADEIDEIIGRVNGGVLEEMRG